MKCNICGAKNTKSDEYCYNCGAKVDKTIRQEQEISGKNKSNIHQGIPKVLVIVILCLIPLIAAGAVSLIIIKNNKKPDNVIENYVNNEPDQTIDEVGKNNSIFSNIEYTSAEFSDMVPFDTIATPVTGKKGYTIIRGKDDSTQKLVYGLLNGKGEIVIPLEYDTLRFVENTDIDIIRAEVPGYDTEVIDSIEFPENGMSITKEVPREKEIYFDTQGNRIFTFSNGEPIYVNGFYEGEYLAIAKYYDVQNKEYHCHLVDSTGNVLKEYNTKIDAIMKDKYLIKCESRLSIGRDSYRINGVNVIYDLDENILFETEGSASSLAQSPEGCDYLLIMDSFSKKVILMRENGDIIREIDLDDDFSKYSARWLTCNSFIISKWNEDQDYLYNIAGGEPVIYSQISLADDNKAFAVKDGNLIMINDQGMILKEYRGEFELFSDSYFALLDENESDDIKKLLFLDGEVSVSSENLNVSLNPNNYLNLLLHKYDYSYICVCQNYKKADIYDIKGQSLFRIENDEDMVSNIVSFHGFVMQDHSYYCYTKPIKDSLGYHVEPFICPGLQK